MVTKALELYHDCQALGDFSRLAGTRESRVRLNGSPLTRREAHVKTLLERDITNREIADSAHQRAHDGSACRSRVREAWGFVRADNLSVILARRWSFREVHRVDPILRRPYSDFPSNSVMSLRFSVPDPERWRLLVADHRAQRFIEAADIPDFHKPPAGVSQIFTSLSLRSDPMTLLPWIQNLKDL